MKQYEAVIKAMQENGGYATLGQLYQSAPKYQIRNGVERKTHLQTFVELYKLMMSFSKFDLDFGV
jgi:hypothetical protein